MELISVLSGLTVQDRGIFWPGSRLALNEPGVKESDGAGGGVGAGVGTGDGFGVALGLAEAVCFGVCRGTDGSCVYPGMSGGRGRYVSAGAGVPSTVTLPAEGLDRDMRFSFTGLCMSSSFVLCDAG